MNFNHIQNDDCGNHETSSSQLENHIEQCEIFHFSILMYICCFHTDVFFAFVNINCFLAHQLLSLLDVA